MDRDLLQLPLSGWPEDAAVRLLARRESSRLEAKGLVDPASPAGRAKVAEAVAGFMSAGGGYLVLGALTELREGIDTITAVPGLVIDAGAAEALGNSLRDSVEPAPLFAGPRIFHVSPAGTSLSSRRFGIQLAFPPEWEGSSV